MCQQLECQPDTLGASLEDSEKREKVSKALAVHWMCPKYLGDPYFVVSFGGFGPANVAKVDRRTIEEYLERYRNLKLRYPDLPCINDRKYATIPMELLYLREQ